MVFFGPLDASGDLYPSDADLLLSAPSPGLRAGTALAGAGDLDGDGIDDLVIGSAADAARLPAQRGLGHLRRTRSSGQRDLATADHVLIGATVQGGFGHRRHRSRPRRRRPRRPGRRRSPISRGGIDSGEVFLYATGSELNLGPSAAFATVRGRPGGGAASAIAGLDHAGGNALLAIGAPAMPWAEAGATFLLDPSDLAEGTVQLDATHRQLLGITYDRSGTALASAGDMNGDGLDDLWVGVPYYASSKRGAAFLVTAHDTLEGPASLDDVYEGAVIGRDGGDRLGTALAGGVDIDGDGFLDLVVGAEQADGPTGTQVGAAWAVRGPFIDAQPVGLAGARYGMERLSYAGRSVAVFPDLNQDGYGDFIVGAYRTAPPTGPRRGGLTSVFWGGADLYDETPWFRDADGDGWGVDSDMRVSCTPPEGYVAPGGDCDDADTAFHPFAVELDCASPDDLNCDGSVGSVDADLDGQDACEGDCDDADTDVYTGHVERCFDAKDNDCDGLFDDSTSIDAMAWYPDVDEDSYGDMLRGVVACHDPGFSEPTVHVGGDCDDTLAAVSPAATEVCDTVDNNCDGTVDEPTSSTHTSGSPTRTATASATIAAPCLPVSAPPTRWTWAVTATTATSTRTPTPSRSATPSTTTATACSTSAAPSPWPTATWWWVPRVPATVWVRAWRSCPTPTATASMSSSWARRITASPSTTAARSTCDTDAPTPASSASMTCWRATPATSTRASSVATVAACWAPRWPLAT